MTESTVLTPGTIFGSYRIGPAGTKAYAIIMQDGDSRGANPILHWVMFNIPTASTTLEAGMTTPPAGSQYGPNYRGSNQAYLGPRTPPGPKLRYHMQVFALDASLALDANHTFADLLSAMEDHVLASGELVGLGWASSGCDRTDSGDSTRCGRRHFASWMVGSSPTVSFGRRASTASGLRWKTRASNAAPKKPKKGESHHEHTRRSASRDRGYRAELPRQHRGRVGPLDYQRRVRVVVGPTRLPR